MCYGPVRHFRRIRPGLYDSASVADEPGRQYSRRNGDGRADRKVQPNLWTRPILFRAIVEHSQRNRHV
ncbi:hypothetical protein D3C77_457740 [compost metagenome]